MAKLLAIVTCFGMCGNLFADFVTVSNPDLILIPAVGVANTYPSNVTMAGVSGTVTSVTVSLFGVTHVFADDMSAAIVSPSGTAVLLFSGAGPNFLEPGRKTIFNLDWTFDDNAAATLPQSTTPVSGTFKPGLFEYDDTFPAPGPGDVYGFTFAPYLTENLNGVWSLYVMDNNAGDSGQIGGGWSLTVNFQPTAVPEPTSMILFSGLTGALALRRWRNRRRS